MLDFGWTEMFVIMAVAVLAIGPKELPALMHGLGRVVRRLQYMKFAVSQQFEDFMREADMNDLGRGVNFEAPKGGVVFDEAAEDEEYLPAAGLPEDDGAEVQDEASHVLDVQPDEGRTS